MSIYVLNGKDGRSAEAVILGAAQSFSNDKQKAHELWILSCYVELGLILEFVRNLRRAIRINKVYLAFDFAEVYKIGATDIKDKLDSIEKALNRQDIVFKWKALKSTKLVHSKGYAVIQKSGKHTTRGVVLITSANFTNPGFREGNVELGYLSSDKKDIQDFVDSYKHHWDTFGESIDTAVFDRGEYLFKFALLSSGRFLHKWSGNLSQYVGIRYTLTKRAKAKAGDSLPPQLRNAGLRAGDTFTRHPLDLSALPEKEVPSAFMRQFTIETYWGRWVPSDAWVKLRQQFKGAQQFIKQFNIATKESHLNSAARDANSIQRTLVHDGWIEPVGTDHLSNWMARVKELGSNHARLERFFMGYDAHALPYSIEQKSDVEELFESISEAIGFTKSKNTAKKKVLSAIKRGTLDPLLLNKKEVGKIRKMLRGE